MHVRETQGVMRRIYASRGWIFVAMLAGGCDPFPDPIEVEGTGTDGQDDETEGEQTDGDEMSDSSGGSDSSGRPGPSGADTTGGEDESSGEPPEPIEDHCTLDGTPAISIGHGGGVFVPFDEQLASIVYGNQGGTHIDIALRASHMDFSSSFVSQIRGYLDGVHIATGNGGGGFVCDPATLYSLRDGIQLRFELDPSEVDGQLIVVEAELTDSAGNVAVASGVVEVVDL